MSKKVHIAVIGCGMISRFHITAIQNLEGAELAGLYDVRQDSARSSAALYGTRAYVSLDEIWADPKVDAVCVCIPSGLHGPVALAAVEHGKHVLIEKPMALTLADCDRIIAAAERNHVLVSVVSQLRFSPAVCRVKKAMEEGLLGKLVSADLYMKYHRSQAYYDSGAWRGTWKMDGGGALMNQGIHGVDLLQYLAGDVSSVFARAKTLVRNIEVEDTLSAVTEFENGALGVIQAATSVYPGFSRRLELCGQKGTIILEEDRISLWDVEGTPRFEGGGCETARSHSEPSQIDSQGHQRQLHNFVSAILGEEPLLIDGREGRKAVALILAAYRSAAEGTPVALKGDKP